MTYGSNPETPLPPDPTAKDRGPDEPKPPSGLRRRLPFYLFVATCETTTLMNGLRFSVPLMFTLLCHELGHFLQARRYAVPASLPYFIPAPTLFGTLGAVIVMKPGQGDRKAIFDIAITGPIAGLIPALVFAAIGLSWSEVQSLDEDAVVVTLGEPLVFQWLISFVVGERHVGEGVMLHPMALAGWVGLFVTALNLIPIGQLDGGHILYALTPRRAHGVARTLLTVAVIGVIWSRQWAWTLMILLLLLTGPRHPPTADDRVPLGAIRVLLGIAALLFVIVGFTPRPVVLVGG